MMEERYLENDKTLKYSIDYMEYSVTIICPFCKKELFINEQHSPYECDCGHEYNISGNISILVDGIFINFV